MSAIRFMNIKPIQKILSSPFGLYFVLLLTFAFNLSSHTFAYWPGDSWWLRSAYWMLYLSLALSFIFGIYFLLEKVRTGWPEQVLFIIAIVVSWLPFGLAISMVDIATSRPATSYAIRELQSTGFLPTLMTTMAVNILPRHLMFGVLIYIIRFYVSVGHTNRAAEGQGASTNVEDHRNSPVDLSALVMTAGFIGKLSENIKSEPQLLQAQEHYLSVTTKQGQELILYKFGQAMREIPDDYGIQIHRSFWVAKDNIRGWSVTDGGVKIILHHGEQAPVSRRFEHYIKQHFSELNE
ncbi:MAG: LytTR family DNA-binding domain-containing protein [Cellvibrionaceae bacterium]